MFDRNKQFLTKFEKKNFFDGEIFLLYIKNKINYRYKILISPNGTHASAITRKINVKMTRQKRCVVLQCVTDKMENSSKIV